MTDDQPRDQARAPLPQRVACRPTGWVPGELLVPVELTGEAIPEPSNVVTAVRARVVEIVGENMPIEEPPKDEPVLLLPDASGGRHLLFVPVRLLDTEPCTMRHAVAAINRYEGSAVGNGAILQVATPNWFAGAQSSDAASPASQPLPAGAYGRRIHYAPQLRHLDMEHKAEEALAEGGRPVQVAVLDTAPGRNELEWARQNFPNNHHLDELLERLIPPIGKLDPSPLETARVQALQRLEANGGYFPVEVPVPYDERDHGIFVAGIVHATAPWANIRLIRVLNDFGVGSLHSIVIGLVGVIASTARDELLVINLSLGVLPPLEQLADIWFGLPIEGLPGCPENPTLQFLVDRPDLTPAEVVRIVRERGKDITATVDKLHAPVERMTEILAANNCLVVAAAGNDSVYRGVERSPRWGPRIPAVYDNVLAVAANTIRPGQAATYSNRGEVKRGDAADVATLGGELAADGVTPVSGMISVYTAPEFPPLLPPAPPAFNTNGWAEWSGTSFAAPIISGIAANLWASQSNLSAEQVRAELNARARAGGRADVPDLNVPSIPVRLTWLP